MEDNTALNQEWNRLQQEFWDKTGGNKLQSDPSLNGWLDTVDDYWRKQVKDAPDEVDSLYQKLLSSSRFFVNFSEPFLSSVNEKSNSDNPSSILAGYLETYVEAVEKGQSFEEGSVDIKGFWKLPFQLWQQQLSILGELPETFLKFIQVSSEENFGNDEFIDACERYLDVLQEYRSAFLNMSMQAALSLAKRLQAEDEIQHSVEEINAIWIDVFEKHYADFVRDTSYSKLYAEVINNWMLLIQQTEQLITPWLKAMNMPTREA